MKKILFAFAFILMAFTFAGAKTDKKPASEPHFTSPTIYKSGEDYEITKVDITAVPNITSLKISVRGVKLGDPKDVVHKLLGHPDEINEMGIYFYKEKSVQMLAIVFDNANTVRRIVIFPAFAKYAVGNTRKILSYQVATDDELRYFLLGVEDDKIKSQTGSLTFRYLKEGFEFTYIKIGSDVEDFMFFLRYPAKIR